MALHRILNIGQTIQKDRIYKSVKEIKLDYPETGYDDCLQIEDNSFWFRHRNKIIAYAIKKYSADKTFVDIGGGNGFVSLNLQNDGIDSVLIEPGFSGCINAKKRGVENVICSGIDDDVIYDESIDSAGLFDVIEHIEDDHKILSDVFKKMSHGGVLYITVPAYSFLWSYEDDYTGHYRRYTLKTLKNVAGKAGFKIVKSTYIFSILPLPIFFSRVLFSKKANQKPNNKAHSKGMLSFMSSLVWRAETTLFKWGIKIPFGSSCFMVLKKV